MAMAPADPSLFLKVLRMGAGSLLFLVGVVLLFFPGPGLLFMAVGVGLIHPPWGARIQLWFKEKLAQRRRRQASSLADPRKPPVA